MKNKQVTILIGPQGSGKSHWITKSLSAVTPKSFDDLTKIDKKRIIRVSQDDQGKTGHWEIFLQAVRDGRRVIVDRINHLIHQRRRYTDWARSNKYTVSMIWFDVDMQTCKARLARRHDHPTIKINDDHELILKIYFKQFEKPKNFEYDDITIVTRKVLAKQLDLRETIGDSKFIVVGDIHGCYDEFIELLHKCNYQRGDFVISVGDLVDRGPKSKEVLEWFKNTPNAYACEGNHDNKARRYWAGRKVTIAHGLDKTIEQCKELDTHALAKWIESWPQIIRLPDVNNKPTYVVHAGVDGTLDIERQPVETCLYARYFGGENYLDSTGNVWFSRLDGTYNILSGHMIHENAIPTGIDYIWLLDGGACQGGELRAFVFNSAIDYKVVEVRGKKYNDSEIQLMPPIAARDELVDAQLLRCDNRGDLRIYVYTEDCVHGGNWNDTTLNSRGIVFNTKTGECVAKPFSKFFNMGEKVETMEKNLPWHLDYQVFEKLDGWLGTLYRYDNGHHIATKGSFIGQSALSGNSVTEWATVQLKKHLKFGDLPDEVTLVFELICSDTHIVVDYANREELVLTAAFNRHTNEEYSWHQVCAWANEFNFTLPRVYGKNIDECRHILADNPGTDLEGFVIRFENGLRVKIKGEDYKRRAAMLSDLTPLSVWRAMKNGSINETFRNSVDSDYHELFDNIVQSLVGQYNKLRLEIQNEFSQVAYTKLDGTKTSRKDFALRIRQNDEIKHKSMMFAILDHSKESVDKYIMKCIRPTFNKLEL